MARRRFDSCRGAPANSSGAYFFDIGCSVAVAPAGLDAHADGRLPGCVDSTQDGLGFGRAPVRKCVSG